MMWVQVCNGALPLKELKPAQRRERAEPHMRLLKIVIVILSSFLTLSTFSMTTPRAAAVDTVPKVVNHFIQNPPYGEASRSCGPVSQPTGGAMTKSYCKAIPSTGEIQLYAGISLPACAGLSACATADVEASAAIADQFHIVHNSLYRLSFHFVLSGSVIGGLAAGLAGLAQARGSTEISAALTSSTGAAVWASGPLTVDAQALECQAVGTTEICVSPPVEDYLNIQHPIATPWLNLTQGTYHWSASVDVRILGYSQLGAGGSLQYLFNTTALCVTSCIESGERRTLVQFDVEDAYPDYTPPSTTASLFSFSSVENGWYRSFVEVNLNATDYPLPSGGNPYGSYGVNTTYYKDDYLGGPRGDWQVYPGWGRLAISSNGKHLVSFYSIDYAGNVEPVKTIDVWIDASEVPNVGFRINGGASYTGFGSVTLTAFVRSDTVSGVAKMRFRNEADSQWSSWIDYTTFPVSWIFSVGPSDGPRLVYAQFKDSAGNVGEANSQIILDNTPPSIPSPQVSRNGDSATFSWAPSTDAGSGLLRYVWRIDYGGEESTTQTSLTFPSNVGHVFYVRAEDRAGMFSDWGSVPFGPAIVARYNVTFFESGLPSGTPWSISVQGFPQVSTSNTIIFQLMNGTGYVYTLAPVPGYQPAAYSERFNVTGATVAPITIGWTLSPSGARGPPGPPGSAGPRATQEISSILLNNMPYIGLGIAGVATAISALAILSLKRRRTGRRVIQS